MLFSSNPDFYPTPAAVIDRMMMDEDVSGKTVLEPSAGSGNIVRWLQRNGADVIACENDPHLQLLLQPLCPLLASDFLTVTPEQVSHIHYIVMNPPFSEGAKHILHAFDIAPAGCTVIALCNSDTLSNAYSRERQRLKETIDLYGTEDFLGNVFEDAERRTRVSVSLVKLYKEGEGTSEFDNYFFSSFDEDANRGNTEGLMPYNFVRELVGRFVAAVKMFDNVMKASREINETAEFFDYRTEIDEHGNERQVKQQYGYLPIKFGAFSNSRDIPSEVTHQRYKRELQKYYWRIIFSKLNMEKYATRELREQINRYIESRKAAPFTMANIYRVIDMVIQTNGQRMLRALSEAFDTICSFSAENSTAGETWKTNANYMVNRRFILPHICEGYHAYSRDSYPTVNLGYSYGGKTDQMADITKALCVLTGRNYDALPTLQDVIYKQHPDWGTWFEWGFFRCRGYKKGTMHFEFLEEDVWYRFNYEVAKLKGWRLPKKSEKTSKSH